MSDRLTIRALFHAALVFAGPLLAACGGSSSPTNPPSSAGAAGTATGASGGTTPSTGGGGNGNGGAGGGNVDDGGEQSATSGSGGEGGAGMSLPDEPALGEACPKAGALACAGAHQKLTLLCSAERTWEANQTCSSGEFCSSTPGPDLGICKAPDMDCAERQPGELFCASDAITLMQCDADGLSTAEVEQCQAGCVDGECPPPRDCPENLVYSCDTTCPGPSTNPSCFELCPTPASGVSPLLDLPRVVNGVKYAIALPAVAPNSEPCSCTRANGALEGVVFRVPSPPGGTLWRFTYPTTWQFRSLQGGAGEMNEHYKACLRQWPFYVSVTPGCANVQLDSTPPMIWLSAEGPVTRAGTLFVELLPTADATCTL